MNNFEGKAPLSDIRTFRETKSPLVWEPVPDEANEVTKVRLEIYRNLFDTINIPGWQLVQVGQSGSHGASAYGYFQLKAESTVLVKVRLSDHASRTSSFDLDIRHQSRTKMADILKRSLESRRMEWLRKKQKEQI